MLWLSLALANPYSTTLASLDADRSRLARSERPLARERARARLLWAFREELAPSWLGTPWAFHGTSTVPGQGTIACGYFVSTLLEDAGLRVERVHMAQQASEYIVKTFADETELQRFRGGREQAVVDWVQGQQDGLYVVGLDIHVGMLVKRGEALEFCHSSYLGAAEVVCAPPLEDPAFVSNYHIVGPVLTDRVLDAWLDGRPIPTFRP